MNTVAASSGPVDLSAESVAGEEDPGAAIDIDLADTGRTSFAAAMASGAEPGKDNPAAPPAPMSPGDEAPPGTPGTGEDVCRTCGGTGRLNGGVCPDCEGTGKVNVGIGGA